MVRWIKLKEYDPNLDHEMEPAESYMANTDGSIERRKYRVRTDADGFVVSGQERFGTDQILLLGDSVAECTWVDDDQRLGASIERELRSRGRRVDVLSGATSDYTTLHALNVWMNKCAPKRFSQLIYMSCGSDSAALASPNGYWLKDKNKALCPIAEHATGDDRAEMDEPDTVTRTILFDIFLHAVRSFGTELILATVPHRPKADEFVMRCYNGNTAYYEQMRKWKIIINQHTRYFARSRGLRLIDIEEGLSDDCTLFYDITHLNERGAQRAVSVIMGQI